MSWDSVTWAQFVSVLVQYRDKFHSGPSRDEQFYLNIATRLDGMSILEKSRESQAIVTFLNQWKCMFFRPIEARDVIKLWIVEQGEPLQETANIGLLSQDLASYQANIDKLHQSLIRLKDGNAGGSIPTMGVACASKILHLMNPHLFVMWDNPIKRHYNVSYGEFLMRMSRFARRLVTELAPPEAQADTEAYLQHTLGYPFKKSLAKYIDEFNWSLAWRHAGK